MVNSTMHTTYIFERRIIMKKMFYRLFALTMVCALFVSMAVSVSAAEWDPSSERMPVEFENGPEAGFVTGARQIFPFTMTANWVTTLLATKNYDKYFVPAEVDGFGATIWTDGNFTHTLQNKMKAGICYYDNNLMEYVPAHPEEDYGEIYHNTDFEHPEDVKTLLQTYGFVKNKSGSGAINGGHMDVFVAYG